MRRLASALVALGAAWVAPGARAQDQDVAAEPPPLDFLEYLGSWQAKDDEWWEIAEWDKDNSADDEPPTAKGRQDGKTEGDKSKSGGDRNKESDTPRTEERP